ncbi:transcriptional activator protein [Papaya leaf curl Lucknow virus 2]|uniref:Transcriptional activator protein n=1 Tax=Papaya leaf curl Lucknow virus 2 TaxID=3232064 RepID=A0A5P1I939_9GEMI|nr:transcriptional activator protein [Papaya severe leaf curl virus]QBP05524.1 transcriptional activator protein [Papaya severe leaf curl virus]
MQNSSPSQSHCTQVPIKVQHRLAKQGTIRRSVDLEGGCSYYVPSACHNHGFTHRGTHHCSSGNEWGVYLEGPKSPIFQVLRPRPKAIFHEPRHHHSPDPVQSQPQEGTEDTEVFFGLKNLHGFTTSDRAFLKSL